MEVDPILGSPRFFRDRFAKALGRAERGNWKEMHGSPKVMFEANREIKNLKQRWDRRFSARLMDNRLKKQTIIIVMPHVIF
jgi:hypothetical protein